MTNNNLRKPTDNIDELLKRRAFEDFTPDFPGRVLAKSRKSIGMTNQATLLIQLPFSAYAYVSLAMFFLGIIMGLYGVPLSDNSEWYSQHAQILNFFQPYGIVL